MPNTLVTLDSQIDNFHEIIINLNQELFLNDYTPSLEGIVTSKENFTEIFHANIESLNDSQVNIKDQLEALKELKFKFKYNLIQKKDYEIIEKTIYTDLLIMTYNSCFDFIKGTDSSLLFNILKESKCPIMVVPSNFEKVNEIIFTFDGKESSFYAIKIFCYLFGDRFRDKEISILSVMTDAEEELINEKHLMRYVQDFFRNVGIQRLIGEDISQEIYQYTSNLKNPLVVMGAYGRSHISHMMVPSVAKKIILKQEIPLFIAHR